MDVFENIEKVLRSCYSIVIEEERYGGGFLIGMDYQTHPYHTLVAGLIDRATSPGDTDAMEAFFTLKDFSEKHPEFLFVQAKTFEQGLLELEKKAALWNQLDNYKIENLLNKLDTINES